ncbi:MAG: anti-sigma factor antagonist [Clostridia bacterium]|nr:anti-sigma factor antagonist [Clostridia bacterium]
MNVRFRKKGDSLLIYLYGELDECSARTAKSELDDIIDANLLVKNVIFDLSGVSFMDSTGIGMFLGRYKKIHRNKIPVFITGANSNVEKIFEISGIYEIMPKK